jgi:hypothetical protein
MLCPFLLQWDILIGANVSALHPGADVVAPSEHLRFSAMSGHARDGRHSMIIAMTCVATLFLLAFGALWHQTLLLSRPSGPNRSMP